VPKAGERTCSVHRKGAIGGRAGPGGGSGERPYRQGAKSTKVVLASAAEVLLGDGRPGRCPPTGTPTKPKTEPHDAGTKTRRRQGCSRRPCPSSCLSDVRPPPAVLGVLGVLAVKAVARTSRGPPTRMLHGPAPHPSELPLTRSPRKHRISYGKRGEERGRRRSPAGGRVRDGCAMRRTSTPSSFKAEVKQEAVEPRWS
jgi:hypothetical protein